MNSRHDGPASASKLLQRCDELKSGCGIQPGGDLVEPQDGGIGKHLYTEADAATLASGTAFVSLAIPDDGVRTFLEPKFENDLFHESNPFFIAGRGR